MSKSLETTTEYIMPRNVARFEWLMYGWIGIAIINMIIRYYSLPAGEKSTVYLNHTVPRVILEIIIVCPFIWLAARRRKNWARWVILISFLGGMPFVLWHYLILCGIAADIYRVIYPIDKIKEISYMIQSIFQFAAVFLIFSHQTRLWFEYQRSD